MSPAADCRSRAESCDVKTHGDLTAGFWKATVSQKHANWFVYMLSGIPGKDWKHPRGAHVAALKELWSSPAPEVQDGSRKPSPLESTRNVSVHSHSSHEVVPGCCRQRGPAERGTKRSGVPALHHLLHTKHQTHTFRDELLSTFSSCFALRSWYGPNQTRTHRNWLWCKVDYYSFFY